MATVIPQPGLAEAVRAAVELDVLGDDVPEEYSRGAVAVIAEAFLRGEADVDERHTFVRSEIQNARLQR